MGFTTIFSTVLFLGLFFGAIIVLSLAFVFEKAVESAIATVFANRNKERDPVKEVGEEETEMEEEETEEETEEEEEEEKREQKMGWAGANMIEEFPRDDSNDNDGYSDKKYKSRAGTLPNVPTTTPGPPPPISAAADAAAATVAENPLIQVLEVFPDVDTHYIQTMLDEGQNVEQISFHLSESPSTYPRQQKLKPPPGKAGKEPELDFLSSLSFAPTKEYTSQAKRILWKEFGFLSVSVVHRLLLACHGHYAICHDTITACLTKCEQETATTSNNNDTEIKRYQA